MELSVGDAEMGVVVVVGWVVEWKSE